MTLFKNCTPNFDLSINMALVNGGFLHYMDMKKFLNFFFSKTARQILKQFHRNVPWMTLFKNCSQNCDLSINMSLVNGGFLHYTDMKKSLKNLVLRNRLSDFEIISQESGFDISRRPDCPIQAIIATGKLP